jgi:lysozyme family protein
MAVSRFGKRDVLRITAGGGAALLFGGRIFAQDTNVLGFDLPREISGLIPRKPLNYLRLAESLLALEREADAKKLPQSPLALGKGQSLDDVADSLYRFAMPRLVALIDRSEKIDPTFADKAGELLAELHLNQHELPDLLRLNPSGVDLSPLPTGKIRFFVQPEPPPEIIFQPGVPPGMETSPPVEPARPVPDARPADDSSEVPLSRARDYASLKGEYGRLFRTLQLRPQFAESAGWHLAMMRRSRDRYENVGGSTGVPWYFIAVTHALEASSNFRAHLHNGDYPLTARTRQVPAGRPLKWLPPTDWESSALDAMRLLGFTGQNDWSLERTLYRLEVYNGLGYRGLGVPTPYLWSFSNHYDRGKYVADGKFSATARSQQCGAAVMLKLLQDAGEIKLDPAT